MQKWKKNIGAIRLNLKLFKYSKFLHILVPHFSKISYSGTWRLGESSISLTGDSWKELCVEWRWIEEITQHWSTGPSMTVWIINQIFRRYPFCELWIKWSIYGSQIAGCTGVQHKTAGNCPYYSIFYVANILWNLDHPLRICHQIFALKIAWFVLNDDEIQIFGQMHMTRRFLMAWMSNSFSIWFWKLADHQ